MTHAQCNGRPHATRGRSNGRAPRLAVAAAVVSLTISPSPTAAQAHHEPHGPASDHAAAPGRPLLGEVVLGEVVPFGSGTARSWVSVGGDGQPTAVGITLTEAALEGHPATATPGLIWTTEYVLDLPDVPLLPFDHIGVNWNPHGHMPSGVYNVPHFDFHFYMIDLEARRRITARGDDLERCRRAPAPGAVPDAFIFAPDSEEPGMGGHWVDPNGHEFHGADFTSTFIFGTHDGAVIFWEPMITKAYLETKPDVAVPLQLPSTYAREGYYPTGYSIRYDAGRKEYTVALEGLALRQMMATR